LSSIAGVRPTSENIRNGKLGLGEKAPFALLLSAADAIPRSQDIFAAKNVGWFQQKTLA
jgi:hypothetical protein